MYSTALCVVVIALTINGEKDCRMIVQESLYMYTHRFILWVHPGSSHAAIR